MKKKKKRRRVRKERLSPMGSNDGNRRVQKFSNREKKHKRRSRKRGWVNMAGEGPRVPYNTEAFGREEAIRTEGVVLELTGLSGLPNRRRRITSIAGSFRERNVPLSVEER